MYIYICIHVNIPELLCYTRNIRIRFQISTAQRHNIRGVVLIREMHLLEDRNSATFITSFALIRGNTVV